MGNLFECLNIVLDYFDCRHLDRLLRVTGQNAIPTGITDSGQRGIIGSGPLYNNIMAAMRLIGSFCIYAARGRRGALEGPERAPGTMIAENAARPLQQKGFTFIF